MPTSMVPRYTIVLACLAASLSCAPPWSPSLDAQAIPTEQKSADLQIGATFNAAHPDYTHNTFYGPGVFFDFDMRYHLGIEGSFSLLNYPAPSGISEKTYQLGVRYNLAGFRHVPSRLNPYARVTGGRGVFNYGSATVANPNAPPAYLTIQNADLAYNMYSIGGGFEYRLNRAITIRVADFEYQKWLSFPPHDLTPEMVSAGIAYHFH